MSSRASDLHERLVHFRIRDVRIPQPEALAMLMHGDDLLQGRVGAMSADGRDANAFAVVHVDEVPEPIVVAVTKILGVL